jgi:hypothetical protein
MAEPLTLRNGSPRWSPEIIAAIVNAIRVLCVPVVVSVAISVAISRDTTHAVAIAYPRWHVLNQVAQALAFVVVFIPFAALAGWRTWVHARWYRSGEGTGWQGVLEAGALGFLIALSVLSVGIVTHPAQAGPYVIFYGGAALSIGLLLGVVLRAAAIVTLKRTGGT